MSGAASAAGLHGKHHGPQEGRVLAAGQKAVVSIGAHGDVRREAQEAVIVGDGEEVYVAGHAGEAERLQRRGRSVATQVGVGS